MHTSTTSLVLNSQRLALPNHFSPSTPISPPFYSSLRAFDQTSPSGYQDPTPRYVPTYSPRLLAHTALPTVFIQSPSNSSPPQSNLSRSTFIQTSTSYDHSLLMNQVNSTHSNFDQDYSLSNVEDSYTTVEDNNLDYNLVDINLINSVNSNDLVGKMGSQEAGDETVESAFNGYSCSYPLCTWNSYSGDDFRTHLQAHQSGQLSTFDYSEELAQVIEHIPATLSRKRAHQDLDNTYDSAYSTNSAQFLSTPDYTPIPATDPSRAFLTSTAMSVSRTLSYGGNPHAPVISRSISYDGSMSAPAVMNNFSFTNRFDPYNLASPVHLARSHGVEMPNIQIDTSNVLDPDYYARRQPRANHAQPTSPSPSHHLYPLSPHSPENYGPSLIPIHVAEQHYYPLATRQDRSLPSPSVSPGSYASAHAALVSATSINRMLARLATPALSPEPDVSSRGRKRVKSTRATSYQSDSSNSSNYHEETSRPVPVPKIPKVKAQPGRVVLDPGDEKIHCCSYPGCGKRFKRSEHTRRHEKTHTDEKNYGCDVAGCGRFFSRSDNLTQHKKTHERAGRNTSNVKAHQMALLRGMPQSSR